MDIDDEEKILLAYGANLTPQATNKARSRVNGTPTSYNSSRNVIESKGSPSAFTPTRPSPSTQTPTQRYGLRAKKGDVVHRYNCKEETDWEEKKSQQSWKVKIEEPFSEITSASFKYMFQKTGNMSLALNDHINSIGEQISSGYNIEPFENIKKYSTDECHYIGRIRSDGRLTSRSVFFESTLESSGGHMAALDLSSVEEYNIFPGQVVGVKGKNREYNSGNCVEVNKVFEPLPLEPPQPVQLNAETGSINIMIAAGPFTLTDSWLFEPFNDLRKQVKQRKPHVCILFGPFLDASHPLIETEPLSKTFDEIFREQLDAFVNGLSADNLDTQVVLVPSFKDVHHHCVYPTPPFEYNNNRVICTSDPSVLSIGGVVIALTSTDILFHLAQNELGHSTVRKDRMGRLSRYIMSQQNFYPLYPPHESVPLDVGHWKNFAQLKCIPHILVIPSDLQFFMKDVDGTVVINPERLTKGASGGTFANIQIQPPTSAIESLADFIIGEIIKI